MERSVSLLLLMVTLAGCREDRPTVRADTAGATPPARSFRVSNPELNKIPAKDSVGLYPITWSFEFLMQRLRSAGLSPKAEGQVAEDHMAVRGARILIPGAVLEVYIYGDANAAARDVDRFDRAVRVPGDTTLAWAKPPALVSVNNMVVVVLTSDAAIRERVRRVLHGSPIHEGPKAGP